MAVATIAFLLVTGFGADMQTPTERPAARTVPTVLFVCEHGSAKSVIAAAYFNKLARERGLPFRAMFRGSSPDPELSPATRAGLTTDGFDVRTWIPSAVSARDVATASRIVVFATVIPEQAAAVDKLIHWNDVPAVSDSYEAASRDIRARVERLIEQLAAKR